MKAWKETLQRWSWLARRGPAAASPSANEGPCFLPQHDGLAAVLASTFIAQLIQSIADAEKEVANSIESDIQGRYDAVALMFLTFLTFLIVEGGVHIEMSFST
ncbi:hypothetical protein E4U43_000784 [Claviceps pusilla]|uniref:Uncharacterized protein n=1 Tax=Claviceps pusilla TaxID=123648 RepID=A0A9P7N9N3_9HYPO|nr:hypothetical protein E4U43_000784 [Claviceps pusilla]